MSSRRGYIARLPAHVREEINQKLYDGWQFPTIADWLHEHTETSRAIRVFDRAEELANSAKENIQPGSIHGADAIIRALLLDTITSLRDDNKNPDKIIELVNAWAKIR
jgi:hypothetical protein